jgi:hypothetical protein
MLGGVLALIISCERASSPDSKAQSAALATVKPASSLASAPPASTNAKAPVGAASTPTTAASTAATAAGAVTSAKYDGATSSEESSCQAMCQVGQTLDCGSSQPICVARCKSMIEQIPECRSAMTAAFACFASRPVADWVCDRDAGMPTLKEGRCDAEQQDVAKCLHGSN